MPDLQTELSKMQQAVVERPEPVVSGPPSVKEREITRTKQAGDIAVVKRLVKLLNDDMVRTALELGVTDSGLRTVLNRGSCSKTMEVAARGVIREMQGNSREHLTYVVTIKAEQNTAFRAFCNAVAVMFMELDT